jgi:OmcA/MtrC family decaheme c-type cytochrome
MALLQCGLAIIAAANLAVPSHPVGNVARRLQSVQPPHVYAVSEAEHYLTPQQVEYIRPGYNITLVSIQIPADRRPLVEVTFTDDKAQPLDRLGNVTPGALSASFILAWYDAPNRDYISYTTRTQTSPITGVAAVQASADSNGTWNELAMGRYTYKFRTALPSGFDLTKTHTLGIYGSRNLASIIGKTYYDNVLYDFRPDGGPVTSTWAAFETATCNACHDPLGLHGGSRREVKLCVLCHNRTQSLDPDTGNSVEMRLMIHKIHNGPNLANGYTIIGNQQAVHDYSHVTYPQDVRNCTTCHKSSAAEGHIWFSNPSRQACGACHDSVDWVTGDNHVAGPQPDDSACASCHPPQGESEFDVSVKGAHTISTKSAQLAGLNMQILNVTGAAPGAKVTVLFKVTNGDGSPVAPSSLASLNVLLGGPTTDYTEYLRENARGATASGDAWAYTFGAALPADAVGSWTASADCYRNVTIDNHTDTGLSVREAAVNPIYTFAVTDAQPEARRTSVDVAKCNKCHETLALHGGQRYKIEECAICHNPVESDVSQRPADQGKPESISLQRMIHRIHTGEELSQTYTVYGRNASENNYNEVLYPGDRRNCMACHATGAYTVPLPDGVIPTVTERDYYSPMQPTAAACLGCHDSKPVAIHAITMTTVLGESCEVCHGNDAEKSVDQVHAR